MIISKRQEIYNLVSALPYSVFQCRVDAFQEPMLKAGVSVQTLSKKRSNFDTGGTHDVNEQVEIFITITNPNTYFNLLDEIVLLIETTLMTNANWVSQFSKTPEIDTAYGYEKAGETNKASAKILLSLEYQDEFEPNIEALLKRMHVDTDVIYPCADPNLLPPGEKLGPDGRIEMTSDYNLE